jgi:hypothetical protein
MRWPAAALVAATQRYLPAALVSEQAFFNSLRIAERIPFDVTSYYLECRLDDSAQVDLLVLTRG